MNLKKQMNALQSLSMPIVPKNKTGGVVTNTVMGIGGLIIGVIVILVITSTLLDANLLTNTASNDSAQALQANFTEGIGNIAKKLPTILLIVAVVFLFGALVLLVRNARVMGVGGGGSL
jgi:hypothetical protein|tara:strand:+ start:27 stop:383 length:357 start_codon:yes stop_codon:yes gene_type:complete